MVDTKYYYYNIKQGTLQQKQQKKKVNKALWKNRNPRFIYFFAYLPVNSSDGVVVGHYLHQIPRCGASVCRKMASNLVFIIPKACWILECVLERWLLKWWAPLQRCGLVKLKVENNINIFYYYGMRWVILKNQHIWDLRGLTPHPQKIKINKN